MAQAIEGIILKVTSLQEYTRLVTLFSKEEGIVTAAVKKRSCGLSPLLKAEIEVYACQKEIWKSSNFSVTTSYPGIRTSLKGLQEALVVAHTLLKALPPHLPMPKLWTTVDTLFASWDRFITPQTATAIFFIHFMAHEGFDCIPCTDEEGVMCEKLRSAPIPSLYGCEVTSSLLQKITWFAEKTLRIQSAKRGT